MEEDLPQVGGNLAESGSQGEHVMLLLEICFIVFENIPNITPVSQYHMLISTCCVTTFKVTIFQNCYENI